MVTPPYMLKLKTGNCDFILDAMMITDRTPVLVALLVTCVTGYCSLTMDDIDN